MKMRKSRKQQNGTKDGLLNSLSATKAGKKKSGGNYEDKGNQKFHENFDKQITADLDIDESQADIRDDLQSELESELNNPNPYSPMSGSQMNLGVNLGFTKTRKPAANPFFKSKSGTKEDFASISANLFSRAKSGNTEDFSYHDNNIKVSDIDKSIKEDQGQSIYVGTTK